MIVRCPKCRFRYDEQPPEGINQMISVCPRCGTPFSVLPDENTIKEIKRDELIKQKEVQETDEIISETSPRDKIKPSLLRNGNNDNIVRRGSRRWIRYVFFLLLAGILFFLYKNYISQPKDMFDIPEQGLGAAEFLAPDSIPSWIEGNWMGFDDGDTVSLTIRSNVIALTHAGRLQSGAFRCDGSRLFCRFSSDTIIIYLLDNKRQQISIPHGNGHMRMKKADYNNDISIMPFD